MKARKRLLALLLCGVMAVSAAACTSGDSSSSSGGGGTSSTGGTSSSASGEASETGSEATANPVAIEWLTTGDTAAEPIQEGDRIIEAINEQLGIDLTVQIVPEGNVESINVAMASGDFPDVVTGAFGTSATQGWIDNGMVIELNQFFGDCPNIQSWIETDYPWSGTDGSYYGVPFVTQYNVTNTLIVMRGDWLEAVNMEYPTTLEEMRAVLDAFTNQDPDGNGQNDTVGFTCDKITGVTTPLDWVFYAYGREYADYALDEDGNVIPWFETESFVPGMQYIKDLWDSGLIDREFMLNDASRKEEKFYQGRAGAFNATLYRHITRHENSLHELYPEGTVVYDLPPAGEDGSFGFAPQGKGGMFTAITAACENPDKAAQFIDFMVSEEGNDLLRLGIEGIHYTMDGDTVVFNEEERSKDAFSPDGWAHALAWGSFYWPLESGYMPDTDPDKDRALASVELASEAQMPNLIKRKTPMEIEIGGTLDDIFVQYFSDMVQGKVEIESGAQELSERWRAQGGEKLLAELTEAYAEQGDIE